MKLRDYQTKEVQDALLWLQSASSGSRRMAVAPTGTGKGTIQIALQRLLMRSGHSTVLLTPSVEIIKGLISRFPGDRDAETLRIYTPSRYLNLLEKGRSLRARTIIVDECHEWIPDNQYPTRLMRALPGATWLGYTATPYRGTRVGTHDLLEFWGKPITVISLSVAKARGYYSQPEIDCVPLIDDDAIVKRGGEFVEKSLNEYLAQGKRLASLCQFIDRVHDAGVRAVVSVASRYMGEELQAGTKCPSFYVSQGTKQPDRDRVYAASRGDLRLVILQLGVLYRGVDLPWLDTLIDAQPTLSPSRWVQTVGRITRPWPGVQKSLLITNRNYERHGFLLSGGLPPSKLYQLESVWGEYTNRYRDLHQWLGFERSRKRFILERGDGRMLVWYRFYTSGPGGQIRDFGVLVSPSRRVAIWGSRDRVPVRNGWRRGKWKQCRPLLSVTGLKSGQDNPPSPAQIRLWESYANKAGLAGLPATSEHITALTFVKDLRLRL